MIHVVGIVGFKFEHPGLWHLGCQGPTTQYAIVVSILFSIVPR